MSLLTRVKLVCTDGDDIFINDGVYGGLMEFMQVPDLMPPFRVIRDGEVIGGEAKSWQVFGPTCDPLDVLPHRLDLRAGCAMRFHRVRLARRLWPCNHDEVQRIRRQRHRQRGLGFFALGERA